MLNVNLKTAIHYGQGTAIHLIKKAFHIKLRHHEGELYSLKQVGLNFALPYQANLREFLEYYYEFETSV